MEMAVVNKKKFQTNGLNPKKIHTFRSQKLILDKPYQWPFLRNHIFKIAHFFSDFPNSANSVIFTFNTAVQKLLVRSSCPFMLKIVRIIEFQNGKV